MLRASCLVIKQALDASEKNFSLLLWSGRLPCIPTILSVGKCKTYYIHYIVCIYTLLCIIMHKGCGRMWCSGLLHQPRRLLNRP